MTKTMKRLMMVLGTVALLVALVASMTSTTLAANLTGGTYTYLINGEEETFTFDPVVRKDGLLLPFEVFQKMGIKLEGMTEKTVTATKDTVAAKVTIGSTIYDLDGATKMLATMPLRLNGRVFLPMDLLKEFGIEAVQDGTMILMRPLVDKVPALEQLTDPQWSALRANRGFSNNAKSDSGIYLFCDFSLMNADIINAANLGTSYGTRARLHSLLQTNTLILVKASNIGSRAAGLASTSLMLVDDKRNQYDVVSVENIGFGLLTSKLAPGTDRFGVLVYPKLPANITSLSLYSDASLAVLGAFPILK